MVHLAKQKIRPPSNRYQPIRMILSQASYRFFVGLGNEKDPVLSFDSGNDRVLVARPFSFGAGGLPMHISWKV